MMDAFCVKGCWGMWGEGELVFGRQTGFLAPALHQCRWDLRINSGNHLLTLSGDPEKLSIRFMDLLTTA